jgi:hypothetical protein
MDFSRDPNTSMTVAVVEAVSSFENRAPTELPTLHDTVDADALAALFETEGDANGGVSCSVTFTFSDSQVTIENGERIVVEALSPTPVARY